MGGERAGERPRPDGGPDPRRPADPGAPRELRRRARTSSGRLAPLAHDPRGRLQGGGERAGAGPGGRRAARGRVGGAPRARSSRSVTTSSRSTARRRSRSSRARGVEVRTMGRGIDDDPAFFLAAGAAGVLAGRMAAEDRRWRVDYMWAISCSTRSSTDFERVLAEHGPLGLVVQLQVHPVDRVVAPLRLRLPDEVAPQLRAGGLRRLAHRAEDRRLRDDALHLPGVLEQVVEAPRPVHVVVREIEQRHWARRATGRAWPCTARSSTAS